MSIKCQNCGAENVDNAKYCCECGKEIGFYCRKCGEYNRSGKFCIFCGAKNDPVDWNTASTYPYSYSRENVYVDESGTYTADRLVFLKGNYDAKRIEIRQGTRIICGGALAEYKYKIDKNDYEEVYDYENAIVEEIIIPDSVTQIGINAFGGCIGLKSINLPNSITKLGDDTYYDIFDPIGAFHDCISLQSIVIPGSVTEIKANTFTGCRSLQTIVIPDSVTQIGECAFGGCSALQSIVIPDSVTEIKKNTFTGCSSLQTIVIPDSVAQIGDEAFYECSSLKSIVIPNSITQIGECAFGGCSALRSIVIPDSVTRLGRHPFTGCSSLQSIVVSEGNTIYDSRNNCNAIIKTESNVLVAGCSQTVIPDSVACIATRAFCCSSLQSIVIPDSVTQISGDAFSYCRGLQSVVIPKGTKEKFQKMLPEYKHLLQEQ